MTKADPNRAYRNRGFNPVVMQKVRELSEQGLTIAEIAEAVDYSTASVDRYRRRMGLPPLIHHRVFTEAELAQAHAMLEDRSGYRQVALTLGTQEERIKRIFPGYALTRDERTERARMGHLFNQIGATLY